MFRSAQPEKGNSGQYYERLELPLGKPVYGWLAGVSKSIYAHYLNGTEPCRRWISRHKLKCAFCSSHKAPVFKSYVPLFDDRGIQTFTIVGERYFHLLKSITLFAPVKIVKLRSRGTPICIERSDWTTDKPPFPDGNACRRDITPWLFRLWKDPELAQWVRDHPEVNDEMQPEDDLNDSMATAMVKEVKKIVKERMGESHIADVLNRVPALNGQGKK
jgi:hypothetical protein